MGVSDKKWFHFTCPVCNTEEVDCVTDSGSQYGRAHWEAIGSLRKFDIVLLSEAPREPDVDRATCKQCGGPATVETSYGFGQPKWKG
jgi:transcription elongation factor Elf1